MHLSVAAVAVSKMAMIALLVAELRPSRRQRALFDYNLQCGIITAVLPTVGH
jgi:hypothetical protein